MTTVGPLTLPICSPRRRARMSVLPPGGNGTTMRIVRPGCDQVLAPASMRIIAAPAAANARRGRFIRRRARLRKLGTAASFGVRKRMSRSPCVDACFVGWAKVRTQTLTRHGPQRALPTLYGAQESKAAQMRVCTAWARRQRPCPFSDVHRGAFADPTTTIGAARRCSSARDLRLEGCDLGLAARGEHADLAGAVIGHDHLQRLAPLFEDRDVARL